MQEIPPIFTSLRLILSEFSHHGLCSVLLLLALPFAPLLQAHFVLIGHLPKEISKGAAELRVYAQCLHWHVFTTSFCLFIDMKQTKIAVGHWYIELALLTPQFSLVLSSSLAANPASYLHMLRKQSCAKWPNPHRGFFVVVVVIVVVGQEIRTQKVNFPSFKPE